MKVYRNRKVQHDIIRTYDRLLTLWEIVTKELDVETMKCTGRAI